MFQYGRHTISAAMAEAHWTMHCNHTHHNSMLLSPVLPSSFLFWLYVPSSDSFSLPCSLLPLMFHRLFCLALMTSFFSLSLHITLPLHIISFTSWDILLPSLWIPSVARPIAPMAAVNTSLEFRQTSPLLPWSVDWLPPVQYKWNIKLTHWHPTVKIIRDSAW